MKRTLMTLALSALSLTPAYAGTVSDSAVSISGNSASGSLKTARASGDANQYIGCYTAQDNGGGLAVICFARDAAGTSRSCLNFADKNLLQSAQSISYRSYVFIQWDANGICNYIAVQNSSDHQ